MIFHSVFLKLKHPKDSEKETLFLNAARDLQDIPGVQNFKVLKQTSPKNQFEYGLSMEFDNQSDYDAYSIHPDHERFIKEFWIPDVADFLEIDYQEL
ncbi:Dabb family protein [Dyadobacter sp. CY323]|uniref:Dabb family protein n=1 Tax=Dyadobacter sp. CY323 TaxID=2907302 RepID=UPI001F380306|nr:Dabb family protein [Dyadobacter sp. CY323]MCE6988013.1 Dabb family protein [Dyadobacter sp. CY323]